MVEQAAAATQISASVNSMRTQSEQAARATSEQTRTMREMSSGSAAIARDIKLITQANRAQSSTAAQVVSQVADVRRITERNVEGVKQARGGTAALLKQAEALTGIMGDAFPRAARNGHNGRGR
jgi:methyl-accepting chemotaxis protein